MRHFLLTALASLALTHPALAQLCKEDEGSARFDPANSAMCQSLLGTVQSPSDADGVPVPLDEYETAVGKFFNNYCYRDPALNFAMDKDVRAVGPYLATLTDTGWEATYKGFHAPVVIWYSPEMVTWLEANRPVNAEGDPTPPTAPATAVPDGVMLIKEMYSPPASRCAGSNLEDLKPSSGIAYMVRDSKGSHDGWFWGYFGFFDGDTDPNVDWPNIPNRTGDAALNSLPYAGFGQYCVNCHASAETNLTFSTLTNISGQPGTPIAFLSMDWFLTEVDGPPAPTEETPHDPPKSTPMAKLSPQERAAFDEYFHLPPGQTPASTEEISLPSQTFDNVWVASGDGDIPPLHSEYMTSDQCLGCHDAGSTGMAFDMTKPIPGEALLENLSPYASWRFSPMGLAGRDPIFYGQVASEEVFHEDYHDLIWNTCFGCHGIMGQRQFQLDQTLAAMEANPNPTRDELEQMCGDSSFVFKPTYTTAVPYSAIQTDPMKGPHYDLEHAKYGALARDGISCVACHRMVLTPEQQATFGEGTQNICVDYRQALLNSDLNSAPDPTSNDGAFAMSFTGSFPVSDSATLFGPFADPKTKPMDNALGNIPMHDDAIASSEQCGTCHTVHLPILMPKLDGSSALNIVGHTFEQTTYPEWAFSQFRTGYLFDDTTKPALPGGPGAAPQSCVDCHIPSQVDGTTLVSKIASIQERTSMPEAENALPAEDIDLEAREGFGVHTLVGLNLFLVSMAEQFPEILGVSVQDPMLVSNGLDPVKRTVEQMLDNAENQTATVDVTDVTFDPETGLSATVTVTNLAGHKFPSGVSFRRAFLHTEVLNANSKVIWESGKTNEVGIILGPDGNPLNGELWYDNTCTKIVDQGDFEPHHQTITDASQVQIYQEVKLNPGTPPAGTNPICGEGATVAADANLTTSFLSICHTAKDNRLMPAGTVDFATRVEIAKALGIANGEEAELMATETGATAVGGDLDYVAGGGDSLDYVLSPDALNGETPVRVRATLYYQATPPFFLQDRFCNGEGVNRDRLYSLSRMLKVEGTPIDNWSFRLVSGFGDVE
ncbi:MAG: hypothetical protein AAGP08_02265 [Pseudomonadota bacterium]